MDEARKRRRIAEAYAHETPRPTARRRAVGRILKEAEEQCKVITDNLHEST
jgi:hypothetical protein